MTEDTYSYQEIQTRIPLHPEPGRITRALEDRLSDLRAYGNLGYKHVDKSEAEVHEPNDYDYKLIVDVLMREEPGNEGWGL